MVLDNFCNNYLLASARVSQITGKKQTMVQVVIIQEGEPFGIALRPSVASEAIHFVVLNSLGESVQTTGLLQEQCGGLLDPASGLLG